MIVFPYPIPTCLLSLKPSWWCTWFLKTNFVVRDHHPPKIILKWFQSYTERIYIILYRFVWKLVLQPPMVYRHNFPVKHCHQFGGGIPPFETHTQAHFWDIGAPHSMPLLIIIIILLLLVLNLLLLILSNKSGLWMNFGPLPPPYFDPKNGKNHSTKQRRFPPSPSRVPRHAAPSQRVRRSSRPKRPSCRRRPVERNDVWNDAAGWWLLLTAGWLKGKPKGSHSFFQLSGFPISISPYPLEIKHGWNIISLRCLSNLNIFI